MEKKLEFTVFIVNRKVYIQGGTSFLLRKFYQKCQFIFKQDIKQLICFGLNIGLHQGQSINPLRRTLSAFQLSFYNSLQKLAPTTSKIRVASVFLCAMNLQDAICGVNTWRRSWLHLQFFLHFALVWNCDLILINCFVPINGNEVLY